MSEIVTFIILVATVPVTVILYRITKDKELAAGIGSIGFLVSAITGGIVGGAIGKATGIFAGDIIGGGIVAVIVTLLFFMVAFLRNQTATETAIRFFRNIIAPIIVAIIGAIMGAIPTEYALMDLGMYFTMIPVGTVLVIVMAICDKIWKFLKSKFGSKFSKPKDHLIAQLLDKRASENRFAYISLCFAFAGELVLYKTAPDTSIRWMMILTALLFFATFINQRIFKYRVDHGLYGYLETREIVAFILEQQRKNSGSNGKPPKLVFTQEELDECLQVNGGEEYAG